MFILHPYMVLGLGF